MHVLLMLLRLVRGCEKMSSIAEDQRIALQLAYDELVDENSYNLREIYNLRAEIKRIVDESNTLCRGYERRIRELEAQNKELCEALVIAENLTPKTYSIEMSEKDFESFKNACSEESRADRMTRPLAPSAADTKKKIIDNISGEK